MFEPTERMPPYLFSLAGGPWHGETAHHDGLDLGVWCRASLAPHFEADEIIAVTRQSLDFQQPLFGRPMPFGRTYDQVFVPDFNAGAMENAALVTFADELFVSRSRTTRSERRLRAQVIAHELAHMWFGNLVTMRWWDDLWLNESFAELMALHTVEEATEYDGAWADFALARKAWGYRADSLPTTHPIAGTVPDYRAALMNFDGISYAKGAAALRQLWAWIGDEAFFAGVRRYLDRHAWGNTSLGDLLSALEQESGRDLAAWSSSWLRTAGTSTIRVRDGLLESDDDRPHHVGVGRYAGRPLRLVERLDLELPGRRRTVEPADLVLPNDGDLTFAKVRLDERSLADRADLAAHPRRPGRPVAGLGVAVGHRPRRRAVAPRLRQGRARQRGGRDGPGPGRHPALPGPHRRRAVGRLCRARGPRARAARSRSRPSPAATSSSPSTAPPWRPPPAAWPCPTGFPRTRSCAGCSCAGWPSSGRSGRPSSRRRTPRSRRRRRSSIWPSRPRRFPIRPPRPPPGPS